MASAERNSRGRKTSTIDIEEESHYSEEFIQDKTFLLASIMEYSDDAILTKTSKGIITSWNHGAERIYGFSAKDVIGQSVSILIPPGQTDEVPALLERIG